MHLFPCGSLGLWYTACMTETKLTATSALLAAVNPATAHDLDALTKTAAALQFENAEEITFDGGRWGIVDAVVDGMIWVIDQDGGDHELSPARID